MKKFIVISSVLVLSIGACFTGYRNGANVSRETSVTTTTNDYYNSCIKTMFSTSTSKLVDKDGNEYKTYFVFPKGETYKVFVDPIGSVKKIKAVNALDQEWISMS